MVSMENALEISCADVEVTPACIINARFGIARVLPSKALRSSVMLLGNFDGFHRGHKELWSRASLLAAAGGYPLAMMSPEPHPRQFFRSAPKRFRISSALAKVALLGAYSVDLLYSPVFNKRFASMTADQFIDEILVRDFAIRAAVVGADFSFGAERMGTAETLLEAGRRCGFSVVIVKPVKAGNEFCSSSRIRDSIESGDIGGANAMLGHEWLLEAMVTSRITDTWRLSVPDDVVLPPPGAYRVTVVGPLPGLRSLGSGVCSIEHLEHPVAWLKGYSGRPLIPRLAVGLQFTAATPNSASS
jgi:riboflavin kinase / FMN adenylyltransferase